MAEQDPLIGFQFRLEIEGKLLGTFTEVGGIGSENEVIEIKSLDEQGHEITKKIPGRVKWQDVTLKRGITDKMDIWDWRAQVEKGDMVKARTHCSVIMMDRNYEDVARWDFKRAWPSKVSGPSLKSDSNEFGVEELTIVHEEMTRVS